MLSKTKKQYHISRNQWLKYSIPIVIRILARLNHNLVLHHFEQQNQYDCVPTFVFTHFIVHFKIFALLLYALLYPSKLFFNCVKFPAANVVLIFFIVYFEILCTVSQTPIRTFVSVEAFFQLCQILTGRISTTCVWIPFLSVVFARWSTQYWPTFVFEIRLVFKQIWNLFLVHEG